MIYATPDWRSVGWHDLRGQLSLIVPPTVEPLDLEEVKKQRKFSSTSIDTLFDLWISGATESFEEFTGRQLMTATWEYWLDGTPLCNTIELPRPPLQEVVSIKYDDGAGVEQTVDASSYRTVAPVGPHCSPGMVTLASGWPSTSSASPYAIRIRFKAGYGNAPGAVPALVRHALYQLVGHFQSYGEAVIEARGTVMNDPINRGILDAFKFSAFPQLPSRRSTWR